ncbi:hypothetical protein VTN77DRAFT_4953 [Rasamsonia byssochlamydoides]|uniref:uncharacterized protein n=1 Tax=Rasamsonia byssochlamydoides TaxID=89139 RepID=UPI0037448027
MVSEGSNDHAPAHAPLRGIKVLELSGVGLAPFTGMVLADYGCDVVRVDPPSSASQTAPRSYVDSLCRRKKSVVVDFKSPSSRRAFLDLVDVRAGAGDSLSSQSTIDLRASDTGFRRNGTTTDENAGLYARRAGHELNFLAVSGVLASLSLLRNDERLQKPSINYLADFCGGSMSCAVGILLALLHRAATGEGQVIDASVVDGVSYLATFPRQRRQGQPEGETALDVASAPYYDVYRTQDGKYMAVAALEQQYYDRFVRGLGLDPAAIPDRNDRAKWLELRSVFTERFASQTQRYWRGVFDGIDACVTPVLDVRDVGRNRPLVSLNRSPSLPVDDEGDSLPMLKPGEGSEEVLRRWLGSRSSTIAIEPGTRVLSREDVPRAKL